MQRTVKEFLQFVTEQNRTELQELYAAGLIGMKDYVNYVMQTEPNLEKWVEKNVIFFRIDSHVNHNRIEATAIYNDRIYLVAAPVKSYTYNIDLLNSDFAEKIEDPTTAFVIRLLPLNFGKTWGFRLSNLIKLDSTESMTLDNTPLLPACYDVLNKHGITP